MPETSGCCKAGDARRTLGEPGSNHRSTLPTSADDSKAAKLDCRRRYSLSPEYGRGRRKREPPKLTSFRKWGDRNVRRCRRKAKVTAKAGLALLIEHAEGIIDHAHVVIFWIVVGHIGGDVVRYTLGASPILEDYLFRLS